MGEGNKVLVGGPHTDDGAMTVREAAALTALIALGAGWQRMGLTDAEIAERAARYADVQMLALETTRQTAVRCGECGRYTVDGVPCDCQTAGVDLREELADVSGMFSHAEVAAAEPAPPGSLKAALNRLRDRVRGGQ